MDTFDVTSEVIEITLTQGYTAIVDSIDADLAQMSWCIHQANSSRPYAIAGARKPDGSPTTHLLHRLILSRMLNRPLVKGDYVDHKNGNVLDNRRSNLRLATAAQNAYNSKGHGSKSGYKGVIWNNQKGKWQARIRIPGSRLHLGFFNSPEDAFEAYKQAALRYHGEFAFFGERP